jgi:hypothetical protein
MHTQSSGLESTGDQLSDGMFAWVFRPRVHVDGASQPSTAELALGPKNTHRKYCHGPGSLNSVRPVLPQRCAIHNGNAH